jgi:hypothetical protein
MLDRRAPTNWTRQVCAAKRRAIPCRRPRPPLPYSEPPRSGTAAPRCLLKNGHLLRCPAHKNQNRGPPRRQPLIRVGRGGVRGGGPSSGRRHRAEPNETALGPELCHEVGELARFARISFLDDDLLGLGCNRGGRARSGGRACAAASPLRGSTHNLHWSE